MKSAPHYPTPEIEELFAAILHLKNNTEVAAFFRDLLTLTELTEFSHRWQIVKLLYQGKSYIEIAEKLQVSTTTVTRVAHWLHHGMGGYKMVADRLFRK